MSTNDLRRVDAIDALRGFALFGVCWANLLVFSGIGFLSDEQRGERFGGTLDSFAYALERFFVENKFMGLFSFLFGVSFWLFLSRVEGRGKSPRALYYRRVGWLFVIGALHGWLFWCFDILRFYALWGLLLPLFVRMRTRVLLAVALAMSVLVPAIVAGCAATMAPAAADGVDHEALALAAFGGGSWSDMLAANWDYDWYLSSGISQLAYQTALFGRLLLGLHAARTLDLLDLGAHRRLFVKIALVAGLAGLVGSSVYTFDLLPGDDAATAFARRLLVEGGQLGLTLFYAAGFALLLRKDGLRTASAPLASIGRMALTWYLLQTAAGIWVFYAWAGGPAWMGQVGPAALALAATASFALQVVAAHWWLARFRQGPAEWLWRGLTWGSLQPLRR